MKGIQNTTTQNFGDLLGNNRKFTVPVFQRDYSWEEEQWDDLWQDVERMIDDGADHYMGYLVLQASESSNEYLVIDGQQRFTTITLIILSALKCIKNMIGKDVDVENNNIRLQSLTETYVGRKDPVTLEYDNILQLNRNNNDFYRDYIVKLVPLNVRGLSNSDKLMKKCFEWYYAKLKDRFDNGAGYADFLVRMVGNLYFTVITVNDEMNAFRVFETLNARGVQLSSADLLKNYLFSIVADGDGNRKRIAELERKWNTLAHNVRTEKLPDFIRYYWNAKNRTVRSSELFKAIKKNITEPTVVFQLITEMQSFSDVYMALKNENDELWEGNEDIMNDVRMLILFGLKQPYSLLMTAFINMDRKQFGDLLHLIIIVCFRYNVICGKNPNDIEKVFNDLALTITEKKLADFSLLKKVYINDEEFENAFALKDFVLNSRNTKVVRYILGSIERFRGGVKQTDIYDDDNSIEHILPQNPNDEWDVDEFRLEQVASRLGNMCLLERAYNRQVGNESYSRKVDVYKDSKFLTTKNIPAHYSSWSEKEINSRQKAQANIAKSLWKADI